MARIELPSDPEASVSTQRDANRTLRRGLIIAALAACITLLATQGHKIARDGTELLALSTPLCPQVEHLVPPANDSIDAQLRSFSTPEYREAAVGQLSRIVQVRAHSYDDSKPVKEGDERWLAFNKLHERLRLEFPLIHERIELQKVNDYGLLYRWNGTDLTLKPLLLMAHQDTDPVDDDDLDDWKYPPFGGHSDGHYLWGNGACDCKSHLTAVMSAVEALLKVDFRPQRTILLSFGFDEESAGTQGAGHLAKEIERLYGPSSIELIVDEGSGFEQRAGLPTAIVDVTEKGYTDVTVAVKVPGGHSSTPPSPHTAIGILALALVELEGSSARSDPIFAPQLPANSPFLTTLRCLAERAPAKELDANLRKAILSAKTSQQLNALSRTAAKDGELRWYVQTSQAADVIRGGVKVNALPENAQATINYRVGIHSSPHEVKAHITDLLKPIAKRFDLELVPFTSSTHHERALVLSSIGDLEPPPISPTSGDQWTQLAGTIRQVWRHHGHPEITVMPSIMVGNTDTNSYLRLTRAVYRFSPLKEDDCVNIHTVNERVGITGHIEAIALWHTLIRNVAG